MYHRYIFYKIYLEENLKLEMPFTWQLFEHQKMALPQVGCLLCLSFYPHSLASS